MCFPLRRVGCRTHDGGSKLFPERDSFGKASALMPFVPRKSFAEEAVSRISPIGDAGVLHRVQSVANG